MRKALCVITAGIMMASALSGCSLANKLGFGKDDTKPVSSISMNEEEAKNIANKMPLNLYFSTQDNSKLILEVRYVDMNEAKKGTASLAGVIVNELIKGPQTNGLKGTIPDGAKLAGPVTLNAGTATINFTKEFVDKHPGGEAQAKLTIYSIVNSLTELTDVQKVKFLVSGKTVTDFKGAYKFDTTFPRTVSLIGKVTDIGPAVAAATKNLDTKSADASKSTTKATTSDTKSTQTATKSATGGTTAPTNTPAPSAKVTPATPAPTAKATPAPTPKKSSSTSPQSSNVKSLNTELASLNGLN